MPTKGKFLTSVLIMALLVTLSVSLTASAAGSKTFKTKSGATVTVSNIIETRQIKDVGYGTTMYVAQAPVTVTFKGDLQEEETWFAKWEDEESLEYVEIVDNKVTLTDPVEYGIFPAFVGENRSDNDPILLLVVDGKGSSVKPVVEAPKPAAQPTASKVLIDGKEVAFEAYKIEDNNYFKLRDLAMALSASEKSFAVDWDSSKNAIKITSSSEYTPVGGELAASDKPSRKEYVAASSAIYLDGEKIEFVAYKIGGNNYFKLRDVADALDIGVDWDGNTKTISINTSKAVENEELE
ncbi:hypothetical protein ACX93W_22320 [Paenibacillus sp. CAU 1782]